MQSVSQSVSQLGISTSLPVQDNTEKRGYTSMPQAGFEPSGPLTDSVTVDACNIRHILFT